MPETARLCPCGEPLRKDMNTGDLVCVRCETSLPAIKWEAKLGIDPGRPRKAVKAEPEEKVQARVVKALELRGYRVLSTVQRRKQLRCRECGTWQWPQGGTGTTPGVPDLLVCVPGGLVGLEVKGPTTAISAEQRELALAGHIVVVRSAEEAVKVLSGE